MNFHEGGPHGSLLCFGHCKSSGLSRLFLKSLRILRSDGWVIVRIRDGERRKRKKRSVVVWWLSMVVVHLRLRE